jgi:hypothetical protein
MDETEYLPDAAWLSRWVRLVTEQWEVKDIIDTEDKAVMFISFWANRDSVKPDNHCRTKLQYKDGSTGPCVISQDHTRDSSCFIPHVDAEGRIPPGITVDDVKSEYNLDAD